MANVSPFLQKTTSSGTLSQLVYSEIRTQAPISHLETDRNCKTLSCPNLPPNIPLPCPPAKPLQQLPIYLCSLLSTSKGSKWAEHLLPEELLQGSPYQPLPTILPFIHLLVHAVCMHRHRCWHRLGCCPPWTVFSYEPRPTPPGLFSQPVALTVTAWLL